MRVQEYQLGLSQASRFTWTEFFSVAADRKQEHTSSLRELAERIKHTKRREKKALPWIKLARFGDVRSVHNSLKTNVNVIEITGVEADYDGGAMSVSHAADLLAQNGIGGMVYTTPSSTDQEPRWRVLCPTSRPYPPEQRQRFLARLNGLLGGVLDPASFNVSLSYYYGNIADRPPVQVKPVEGGFIDLADELDEGAMGRHRRPLDDLLGPLRQSSVEKVDISREQAARLIQAVPNDHRFEGRDEWRNFIAAIHHQFDGDERGLDLALRWSAGWHDDDPSYTEATYESFTGGGSRLRTFRSIEKLAAEAGVTRQLVQIDPVENFENTTSKFPTKVGTLEFSYADQIINLPEPLEFIEGVLAMDTLASIFGPTRVGKTFIALDMAMHVALERVWRGRRVLKGGVVYIALEGIGRINRRFKAWCLKYKVDPKTVPIVFGSGAFDVRKGKDTRDRLIAFTREAAAKWGVPVRWIVIDTLARAMAGGNENAAEDMGAFREGMDIVRRGTGACVATVHHTGKDPTKGARGSNVLLSDVETEMEVKPGLLCLSKQKEGQDGITWGFGLEVVKLGYVDQWGKDITSCVAIPANKPERKTKALTTEEVAMELFATLAGDSNHVDLTTWKRVGASDARISTHEVAKRRHEAMSRVIDRLLRKHVVRAKDGKASIPVKGAEGFEDET